MKAITETFLGQKGTFFKVLGSDRTYFTPRDLPTINNREVIITKPFSFSKKIIEKRLHLFFKEGRPICYTTDESAFYVKKIEVVRVDGKPHVRNRVAVEILKYKVGDLYDGKIIRKIGSRWKQKKTGKHLEYIYT